MVVYCDDWWDVARPRPSFSAEQVMVHVAWLHGVALVRYLSWATAFRDVVHDYPLPADGVLVESSYLPRRGTLQLLVPGPKYSHTRSSFSAGVAGVGVEVAALTPWATTAAAGYRAHAHALGWGGGSGVHVKEGGHWRWPRAQDGGGEGKELVVVHVGGLRASTCPGAFLKLVALLHESHASVQESVQESVSSGEVPPLLRPPLRLRFKMLGGGHLQAAMMQYAVDMGLQGVVEFVDPHSCTSHGDTNANTDTGTGDGESPPPRTDVCVFALLSGADLLVDACATTGAHGAVFPLALLAGTPVVGFASGAAQEWLQEGEGVFVGGGGGVAQSLAGLAGHVHELAWAAVDGTCGPEGAACFGDRRAAAAAAEAHFAPSSLDTGIGTGAGTSTATGAGTVAALRPAARVLASAADAASSRRVVGGGGHGVARAVPVVLAAMEEGAGLHGGSNSSGSNGGGWSLAILRALVSDTHTRHQVAVVGPPMATAVRVAHGEDDGEGGHERGGSWQLTASDRAALDAMRDPHSSTATSTTTSSTAAPAPAAAVANVSLLCSVFTQRSARVSGRLATVRDTYGRACDGFLAFSDEAHAPTNSMDLSLPQGPQHYHNMWQKTRSIWTHLATFHVHPSHFSDLPLAPPFMAQHYAAAAGASAGTSSSSSASARFDWFVLGGDDMYVLPARLRSYLGSVEVVTAGSSSGGGGGGGGRTPLYLGRPLRASHSLVYNTGGPGYVLNARAVAVMYNLIQTNACLPDARSSLEDIFVAECLGQVGVAAADTADARGRQRFHWHAPGVEWEATAEAYTRHAAPFRAGLPVAAGADSTAPDSVALHDLKPAAYMRAVHAYLFPQDGGAGNH